MYSGIMRGISFNTISCGVLLGACLESCAPSLSQNFTNTLPGGDQYGRQMLGVQRSDTAKVVVLDTTGMSYSDVFDAEMERFSGYLNDGLVPIGKSSSTNTGQTKSQAEVLASRYGACVAIVEIRDPPPYEKTIETNVPTLVTESVRIDGTASFQGNITRTGWGPGTINVWVDPYFIECTLWGKRSWPPLLGVYFAEEMRSFRGTSESPVWPVMKSTVDRWKLRHPGELPPQGAEVSHIIPGTLAERITIRPRDILLSIDGKQITSEGDARQVIEAARGRDVELVVLRHMANRNLDVADGWTVSSPPSPLFQDRTHIVWRQLSRQVTYPVIAE